MTGCWNTNYAEDPVKHLIQSKNMVPWRNLRLFIFIVEGDACMQRMNIKCCHCGDYTPFIAEENIEVIPQVNLTRTDMDILGNIAETLAECGCFGARDFLRRVQSEATIIVEYQEEW